MQRRAEIQDDLLRKLFRLEQAKMTAVLFRHFGLQHMEVAEDIVSETFLKATESWRMTGIPENPEAWLYVVGKNKAKDYLKRVALFESQIKEQLTSGRSEQAEEPDFDQQTITDSQLAMIFTVCNPVNSQEAQICLALQILCGFSIAEIAAAFLTQTETIKKRLLRARNKLRGEGFQISQLSDSALVLRLDTVLRTLYLLFNEGYFSSSGKQLIRSELCAEAIRLTLLLVENPQTSTDQCNALLALMCFQSSRFEARINKAGENILFEQQDKQLWNRELIERGNFYLVNACSGNSVSKYHLEAGIAYWHTVPDTGNKWNTILQLYNQLLLIEYTPLTALNRTFAFSRVYGKEQAICEAEKLGLEELNDYHALLGYLYADIEISSAIIHYQKAIKLTSSNIEKSALTKELERLKRITNEK
ncbi:RNA polymerase sigma-70 factor (ECF subfamily) [Pedobacter cryoconitis]|uniref:RNA polymerase sigma-70 factor (ECF subfamily) n=1 Tax=Pedobacter cryoconitis TaxID=188932 RepID=A0A7W9E139_9SPHI|nr:sigma-70 family RNA polymerase sigma factor [Pedobacter cryoconitis]MBB5637974.1 RNA polymerase sigma-70 factor (ECF subfamily) [Pedobacter cryoconitis]